MIDNNIEYYNENAESFFYNTVDADMSLWRNKFESHIADGGRILDAGCGSGRDSRAFRQHGFSIVAFDASREMCRMASELLGQEVWQMRFDVLSFDEEFDGIWACASRLHVPEDELPGALLKLHKALKPNGRIYVSFKYGNGMVSRGERVFTNHTEETLEILLRDVGYRVIESGITTDVRPGRDEEKWINAIAEKMT